MDGSDTSDTSGASDPVTSGGAVDAKAAADVAGRKMPDAPVGERTGVVPAGVSGNAPASGGASVERDGAALDAADVLLVYDGECPACDNYCRIVRIREDVGRLVLVDAREDTPILREITARGLDIDEGMVLKLGETLYHGSDAIHVLALLGTRSGVLNRLNHHLFRSPRVAAVLYPVLRRCRALLLRLLGRTRVNNLGLENNERF